MSDKSPSSPSLVEYPSRRPEETDKQYLKRVAASLPAPVDLPDDPANYFHVEGAVTVPIGRLRSSKSASDSAESAGSEHRSLGSISVGPDARWTATLTVPIPPRALAFLEVERRGELPAGYRGAEERAFLSLPIGETEALIDLLTGLVAQARRDGVLPTG